jgi:anti-sigma regulatory factor (Ser/Thr protein kinase)
VRKQWVEARVRALCAAAGRLSAGELAAELGVTRQAAHRHLAGLVRTGVLEPHGAGRGAHYRLAAAPSSRRVLPIAGLEEDVLWRTLVAEEPALALPETAAAIARYALTEMVNNAIDHARASWLEIEIRPAPPLLRIELQDDGVGVFHRVATHLGLASKLHAIGELVKGRFTTDPERHTGEGIFFTSKAVERFALASDGLCWLCDNRAEDFVIRESRIVKGTRVGLAIDPATERRLKELFDAFTEDFAFTRTRIVVRLFEHGAEFVSRSEAKRLLLGLERFREVVLDYAGVRGVGQGFADEVARVWPAAHPEVRVLHERMNDEVAFMLARASRA